MDKIVWSTNFLIKPKSTINSHGITSIIPLKICKLNQKEQNCPLKTTNKNKENTQV